MAQSRKVTTQQRGRALPRNNSRRMPLFFIILALVILVGIGAIVFLVNQRPKSNVAVVPFTPRAINVPTGTTPEGFAFMGKADAPVTVIEYGDFQCPSCGAFATQQEAVFTQRYVDSGQVRFIYHDFPLPQHANAVNAAAAARAAGEQGKFWQMHELLFARQRLWSESTNVVPLLQSYADALGLDRTAFDQALSSNKFVPVLEAARQQSEQRGVNATPTFEVNGKLVDAGTLEAAVQAALQGK
ncbi:MAG: DsbA family protein [Chloroflexi bacterium SZAS-1]|jgi:protein-disulfide isomerase|nr:DsbA family protein [Chloroflexi bacterium SZAS-1]